MYEVAAGVPGVLFVDDDPAVLAGLRRMLRARRLPFRLHFAGSAEEALELLATERPDGVVSDMRMPRTDGAELLAAVRDEAPEVVRVILSGQTATAATLRAAAIAHRFLDKPTPPEALVATIASIAELARAPLPDALRARLGGLCCLPSPRATVEAFRAALRAPAPSPADLLEAIGGDLGITSKLRQLTSSAFFAAPVPLGDELGLLGRLDPACLQALVDEASLAQEADGADLDSLATTLAAHALRVHRLAEALHDGPLPPAAALGARLVDLGTLAFAAVGGPSADTDAPGVAHHQVAAYLLALWGFPDTVVDAVTPAVRHAWPPGRPVPAEVAVMVADALDAEIAGLGSHDDILAALRGALEPAWLEHARTLARTLGLEVAPR